MLSLKTHAIISSVLFAVMIVGAIAGNVAHDSGWLKDGSTVQFVSMVVFFTLFIAFGYSLIPVMVKLVLRGHVAIGNGGVDIVRTAIVNEVKIVMVFWTLITVGLAVALPAAIKEGFFSPDPAAEIAATPIRGTLVARPGLTVDEVRRLSSLPIKGKPEAVLADGTLFDFTIAGTVITFPRCRYYYMTTSREDRTRIANISIGTAQSKMTLAAVDKADAELRARLTADRWLAGHEVYRDAQDRTLHGGATRGPDGNFWLKDGTTLRIMRRRLDDAKPGESAGAGDFIQYVELATRDGYPWIERYEFTPARQ